MRKTYKMRELDCANCAAKMEREIGKIDGVEKASISFMTQKMTITVDDSISESDLNDILHEARKRVKRVERDCDIVF